MVRRKMIIIPCLAMATALSWGAGQCFAETQEAAQSPPTNGASSTGNFRETGNVPKLRSTTNEQRMEAAKRLAERRAAAAAAAKNAPSPVMVSPQEMNGGTK